MSRNLTEVRKSTLMSQVSAIGNVKALDGCVCVALEDQKLEWLGWSEQGEGRQGVGVGREQGPRPAAPGFGSQCAGRRTAHFLTDALRWSFFLGAES